MKLIFLSFKKVQRDNGYDGITYLFDYKLVDPQPGAIIDSESEFKIEASIVRTLAKMWNYTEEDLPKVLSEFAKEVIVQKLVEDSLGEFESFELHSNNVGKQKIYDPNKIEYPENSVIEIDINTLKQIKTQQEKQKRKIGF